MLSERERERGGGEGEIGRAVDSFRPQANKQNSKLCFQLNAGPENELNWQAPMNFLIFSTFIEYSEHFPSFNFAQMSSYIQVNCNAPIPSHPIPSHPLPW